jgi:hypothetical protein
MIQSDQSRRELEILWQTRLEQAARRHGMANVRYVKAIEESLLSKTDFDSVRMEPSYN